MYFGVPVFSAAFPPAIGVLAIGVFGLCGMMIFLNQAQRLAAASVKVESVQRLDAQAMSYIVTYVIPFLALPSDTWQRTSSLLIFLFVLCLLYVNSNMIHINPMLNLLGYHLYEITLENGSTHALITRHRVVRGQSLSAIKVGDDILIAKGN